MSVKAAKFTPAALLSAPRRSPGIPNAAGTKILFTVSTYSFDEHKKTSQIRVLDVGSHSSSSNTTDNSTLLFENTETSAYSSPVWVDDDAFLLLKSDTESGATTLLLSRVSSAPAAAPTEIQTFPHGLADLKTRTLADNKSIAIALTGLAAPDGTPFNAKSAAAKAAKATTHSSARVYTKLFVRHWDAYVTENTATIWYGKLVPAGSSSSSYTLSGGALTNLLKDTGLESPVPPFGGADDFALGPKGIAFVARDPDHNPALTTITNLYYVPLESYDGSSSPPPAPLKIETGKLQGYSSAPAFSPDGNRLAFTRMKNPVYESDKTQLVLLPDVDAFVIGAGHSSSSSGDGSSICDVNIFFETEDGTGSWDARPDSILWSADGNDLYVTAERFGRHALFRLPSSPQAASSAGQPQIVIGGRERLPDEGLIDPTRTFDDEGKDVTTAGFRPLLGHGSVVDVKLLVAGGGDPRLFVSMTSQVDSSLYTVVDPTVQTDQQQQQHRLTMSVLSSQTNHGAAFGLSRGQLGETWFKGADDAYNVHALVVRPSNFRAPENEGKKWPLALLIHGGPQGAWSDSWSTRWNPAVFAEQGYVVVAPNPTGSTGYGMALQDGIQHQWGGRPYDDLARCLAHVEATMPYVDTSRAVALGASYGGYMINWIQGHALGRRFRALVCHDGVFSTLNQYASEELFFPLHDFGGTLWDNRAGYARWDPAQFTGEWATPMLVIHNELDYRLPVTEGLSMFNVLQSRGVPSRLLTFPDENHWVLKPENSLVWHDEVLSWINKYSAEDDDAALSGETEKLAV